MARQSKNKWIYLFSEGNAKMKELLGGKGANLAEMTNLKLPVPPGFTITTQACNAYFQSKGHFPKELIPQVKKALTNIEKQVKKNFGDPQSPLLVSIRSGAKFSMPGMMDTILNLGINDQVAKGLVKLIGNERFVLDSYRRFLSTFSKVVLGIEDEKFEKILDEAKKKARVEFDYQLSSDHLTAIINLYKKLIKKETGHDFPQEPLRQLTLAIEAVFKSWNNLRAITYRNTYKIPHHLGTACNVQTMVFGNMGDDSGTGVVFTRDPSSGEKKLYGNYLVNAQGEDVVAGVRNADDISALKKIDSKSYTILLAIAEKLEKHYHNVQDMEFTIEKGKLWMLQTRNGKRTAQAAIKIAVDMVKEKLATPEEAVMMLEGGQLDQLLHPQFDPKKRPAPIAKGVAASPGAASGKIVFDADTAEKQGKQEKVVLVCRFTSPDDIHGMKTAQGFLTAEGGKTSHAAVVARQMGKPCVVGCTALSIDPKRKTLTINGHNFKKGDWLSFDGVTGEVMTGQVPTKDSEVIELINSNQKPKKGSTSDYWQKFMVLVDRFRKLGIRTNADLPKDAELALKMGAEGIGLCRTEHMFFEPERISIFQEMILVDDPKRRKEAIEKLLKFQRQDFLGILKSMDGLPVIIRLLDPPLHEFLPQNKEAAEKLSKKINLPIKQILNKTIELHEGNPMLGHRGCRLGITFPEVYQMQVEAIYLAASELKKQGLHPIPEVMIPLVGIDGELAFTRERAELVAETVLAKEKVKLPIIIGTMIEIPRACLVADRIAELAQFFSFGTNDLTQTVYGFSRDDAEAKFLPTYITHQIIQTSPFETLDQTGVGQLMKMAIEKGKAANPRLEIGICGEQGGDPESVMFCHTLGMNYVSCAPLRIPVAKLAAAQAAIGEKQKLDQEK